MLSPAWEALVEAEPVVAQLFEPPEGVAPLDFEKWLASAGDALEKYFQLEDPTRLEPAERALYVEPLLDSTLLLRVFIDRLAAAPTGILRVVDTKSGRPPTAHAADK